MARILSGRPVTFTEPRIWLGRTSLRLQLPHLGAPIDYDWTDADPDWHVFDGYVNGVTVTYNNPTFEINSSDLGQVYRGVNVEQNSVGLASQTRIPSRFFQQLMNGLKKATKDAVAQTVSMTITSGVSSDGSVTVRLNGVNYVFSATAAAQSSPTDLATLLRTGTPTPAIAGAYTRGGTGTAVTFTAVTAGSQDDAAFVAGSTGAAATVTTPTYGHGAIEAFWNDPSEPNNMIIGMEGWAAPDDDPTEKSLMRWIGFNCAQGGNVANRHDWPSADGNQQPTLSVECLTYPVATILAEQAVGTGITADILDPKGRETMWVIEQAA